MQRNLFILISAAIVISLSLMGFQCGSPEFTGAKVYIQQKNYKEAARLLEQEVHKNPANEEAWFMLGELRADEGNYEAMNATFASALKISNKHAREIRSRRFSIWGGHLNAAVGYMNEAAKVTKPVSLSVGMSSIEVTSMFGGPDKKVEAVYKDLKSIQWVYEKKNSSLFFRDDKLEGWVGEIGAFDSSFYFYNKAIDEFKKAIAAWPDTGITYVYLGHAYNNKNDIDNALASYNQAWEIGKTGGALKQIGRIYLQRGNEKRNKFDSDNAGAIRDLKNVSAVNKGTKKADVMKNLGAPDNVKKGPKNTKKEEWTYNNYNLVVGLDGDVVTSKVFSKPFEPKIDSTSLKEAFGDFNKSIEVLEKAKDVDSKDNEVLTWLLQAYVQSDRIKEAIATFKQAVVNEPTNKMNRYLIGVLYRTDMDYEAAIASFKEAIKIDANYADAIYELGASYYNWGVEILKAAQDKGEDAGDAYKEKFKEAIPYLEKVTELKKDDAQVWETLGTIYARLGQSDKALKALNQADELRKGNQPQ